MLLLFAAIFVFSFLSHTNGQECCMLSIEYEALYSIYDSMQGLDWVYLSPTSTYGNIWNFTDPDANCPCTDSWQGVTCVDCSVTELNLSEYNLNGSIPSTFGNLKNLTVINFNTNAIKGTIGESITSLSKLTDIQLGTNDMTGTIPDAFWNLTSLQYLNIPFNEFIGTLSPLIGQLTNLINLYVYNTKLEGCIPQTIVNMTSLQNIRLSANLLTGTLPEGIGSLIDLKFLNVANNNLNGSIPRSIVGLQKLTTINLSTNRFTGVLEILGNLIGLTSINVCCNLLTGPVEPIFNLTLLTTSNLYSNALTGDLSRLHELKDLETINWSNNLLTGTLPDTLGELTSVGDLSLIVNLFTGTIPASVGNMSSVYDFSIQECFLSGSLPDTFGDMLLLELIQLNGNLLSGTLPQSLQNARNLSQLWISNNLFSGSVTDVLDKTIHSHLTSVLINNNYFTGKLPNNLFGVESLDVFIASVNCFQGTIPASVCDSQLLSEFVVNGASSATRCRQSIFPKSFDFNSYSLKSNSLGGSIPPCLFAMPNLNLLQLSGNSFSGSLDSSIEISTALQTLVMSHNQLSGSIPKAIQKHLWTTLDLSYNRFNGGVQDFSNIAYHASLTLEVNRLSGEIPSTLNDPESINVLDGNIFECGFENQGLPPNDVDYDKYQCGSNNFNAMLVAWMILLVVCGCAAYWLLKSLNARSVSAFQYGTTLVRTAMSAMTIDGVGLGIGLSLMRKATLVVAGASLCLLAVYGSLRYYYSSYQYLYAWTLSAIFLGGSLPAFCLFIVWTLFYCILLILAKQYKANIAINDAKSVTTFDEATNGNSTKWHRTIFVSLLLLANLIVVMGANIGFVLVSMTSTVRVVSVTQVALAVFKIGWSRFLLSWYRVDKVTLPGNRVVDFASTSLSSDRFSWSRTVLYIVNNILIPMIATAVVEVNCFYNAFAPAAKVSYSFALACEDYSCDGTVCTCTESYATTISSSFPPPFSYSDQCSSTIIKIYIPVFTLMLLFDTFLMPIKSALLVFWFQGKEYSGASSCFALILNIIHDDISIPCARLKPLNAEASFMVLINHVLLLMTWGLVFPPLAVLAVVALWVRSYHFQIAIGRRLHLLRENVNLAALEAMQLQLAKLLPLMLQSILPIIWISSLLCSLVVFDTLCDEVGFVHSFWVILVLPSVPFVFYYVLPTRQTVNAQSTVANSVQNPLDDLRSDSREPL